MARRRNTNTPTILKSSGRTAAEVLAFYTECASGISEYERRRNEALQGDLAALFDAFPALDSVVLRGYTPGFNDGDPCYHHDCEPIVNGDDPDDYDAEESKSNLSEADTKAVYEILGMMQDAVRDIYDTNFEVTVTRTPDGVTINQDHYDCGY
jgi:hypothetical protein